MIVFRVDHRENLDQFFPCKSTDDLFKSSIFDRKIALYLIVSCARSCFFPICIRSCSDWFVSPRRNELTPFSLNECIQRYYHSLHIIRPILNAFESEFYRRDTVIALVHDEIGENVVHFLISNEHKQSQYFQNYGRHRS